MNGQPMLPKWPNDGSSHRGKGGTEKSEAAELPGASVRIKLQSEQMNTEFLDRLAEQLKRGKSAACRRAISRMLTTTKVRATSSAARQKRSEPSANWLKRNRPVQNSIRNATRDWADSC